MAADPIIGGALPTNLAAIIAEELTSLAADARTLQGRLTTGDVVPALVLPSNGLTDLLAIGGLRVAAELPPTLTPGQTIMVEVTGFTGDRINLQVLPTAVPPAIPDDEPSAALAPAPAPSGAPDLAAAPASSVVAASVATPNAGTVIAVAPGVDATATAAPAVTDGYTATSAGAGRPARPLPVELGSIEARIATSHATVAPPVGPAASGATGRTASGAAAVPPLTPAFLVRSFIAPRPAASAPSPAAAPAADAPSPRGPAAFADAATLLRAVRLAVTPGNVALARLALTSPERLPEILATLERALPAGDDPHVATLRTVAAFVGRIAPESPVLAAQVAAFVDQLVVGRETKLVQLLAARAPASPSPTDGEAVVVRAAALDYDLKSNLIALASDPQAAKTPELSAALGAALTAITGLQVNAAVALAAHPDGLAFTLPIVLPDGSAAAHVRVDRDAPGRASVPLDGDNFHIGFVLETRRLGIVAIDVQTVGRTVTLALKTEGEPARRAFAGALAGLTRRLEALRYRVAAAEASVAPRATPAPARTAAAEVPAAPAVRAARLVDLNA